MKKKLSVLFPPVFLTMALLLGLAGCAARSNSIRCVTPPPARKLVASMPMVYGLTLLIFFITLQIAQSHAALLPPPGIGTHLLQTTASFPVQ